MTFKKPNKKQRQYRKRSEEAEESTPVSVDADSVQESNGTNEEVNNHTSSNDNPQQNEQDLSSSIIADALELRKLRKKFKGIEASELLKSDPDKVKEWAEKDKKKEEDDPWKLKSGGFVDLDKVKGTNMYGEGPKLGSSFTSQNTAMDTNRHMEAFIEAELRKAKGSDPTSQDPKHQKPVYKDPTESLYEIPEHLKVQQKYVSEENVTISTSMLTAIPEVDLGINAKIKNIEETERAKKRLLDEQEKKKQFLDPLLGATTYGKYRYQNIQVKDHRQHQNQQQHSQQQQSQQSKPDQDNEKASDDFIAERFKKRMRRM